jgi:L-alanine-DL-glutamate epimerase-like enolase superfamily enzyme
MDATISRRAFLGTGAGLATTAALWTPRAIAAPPRLRVTGFDLVPVRATDRTVWLIVRLRTDAGLTGLGEVNVRNSWRERCSHRRPRVQARALMKTIVKREVLLP